ncbi:hypothetical protein AB0F73_13850 [Micromonospora purpureochromogenes]|uniref:hypothetical protein n=1 Tax=Micromonospora purpureochromogenes TaxID=47872 RepID=UPI0033DE67ED
MDDRRLPPAGGLASATVGNRRQQVGGDALLGLPAMIDGLRDRGYTFVTVSQLVRRTAAV